MSKRIVTEQVVINTTGTAGNATGTGRTSAYNGKLLQIYLDFHASAPATTDTTIAYPSPFGNVWARSDSAADLMVAPRIKPVDNANAAITNAHDLYPANLGFVVTLAQCDQLTAALTATFWFEVD